MKLHGNARTCPKSRRSLVERLEGEWSLTEAAEAAGVSERTAAKWLTRWRAESETGLLDRSSAPKAGRAAQPLRTSWVTTPSWRMGAGGSFHLREPPAPRSCAGSPPVLVVAQNGKIAKRRPALGVPCGAAPNVTGSDNPPGGSGCAGSCPG
jgi:hypothetical protein